jgi:hypothetical protein
VFRALGLSMIGLIHPKMLWLSLRPFLFVSIAWGILFFFIWEPTLEIIRIFITTSFLTAWIADVMSAAGWEEVRAVMAPLLLVMVLIPLITISLLVFVAFTSIPSVVKHLSKQTHYQSLHQANAGGIWGSIAYALISIFICLFFLLITLPIWWIPPMVAILPPLLWGWLTMRLMSYDVLALHASAGERDALIAQHRWRLLSMGIVSGMLGAVPTFFWATSAMAMIFFPIVSFFALWIYSLVFIFSALWFAHFLLNALHEYRLANGVVLNDA